MISRFFDRSKKRVRKNLSPDISGDPSGEEALFSFKGAKSENMIYTVIMVRKIRKAEKEDENA